MATIEDVLAAVQALSAKVDAFTARVPESGAAAPPAGTLDSGTLPGSIVVPVQPPFSHERHVLFLSRDAGKAVEIVVPAEWRGQQQGFTWTFNEADPSGRSARVTLSLMNEQGATVVGLGSGMPGTGSFGAEGSGAPPWQPLVPPGRYMLAITSSAPTLIDFEFH